MSKKKGLKKRTKKALLVGGVLVLFTLVSTTAYASTRRRKALAPKIVSEKEAVEQAFSALGSATHPYALTDFAYTLAYPDCPPKLDPQNPQHNECIGWWLSILEKVKSKQGITLIPDIDPDTDSISEDITGFINTLSQEQKSALRELIGPETYDNLTQAALNNNDVQVRAHILGLRRSTEDLITENPLAAWSLHSQLQDILGQEKLDEFLRMVS